MSFDDSRIPDSSPLCDAWLSTSEAAFEQAAQAQPFGLGRELREVMAAGWARVLTFPFA